MSTAELKDIWPGGEPYEEVDEPATPARTAPLLTQLSTVEPRKVSWLWEPYLPAGMLAMLSGDPGTGKSFVGLSLAADLTRGRFRDGRKTEPAGVIYLSVENPIAETIRPRFDLLAGDPSRLYMLTAKLVPGESGLEQLSISLNDTDLLHSAISQTQARLLIVDPIQSFLGSGVDLHRSNETRPVMDGLGRLAEETGCTVLLLRHLNKQSGGKAIHRGLGSIDLTGAVRSEMLAGSLPDDPEQRALVHVKSNVGPLGRTQGYTISSIGEFRWTGESALTAADMLAAPSTPGDTKFIATAEWLRTLLSAGPMPQREIQKLADGEGYSYRTLRRAKVSLRVESYRESVKGGWFWRLPENESPSDDQEGHEEGQTKKLAPLGNLATFEEGQIDEEIQAKSFKSPRGPKNVSGHLLGHLGGNGIFAIAVPEGAGDAWEPPDSVEMETLFGYGYNATSGGIQ